MSNPSIANFLQYLLQCNSNTIKGEGDTQLESEAQLYSDNSVDLKIMQVKVMQSYKTNQVGGRASQVGGITCKFKGK